MEDWELEPAAAGPSSGRFHCTPRAEIRTKRGSTTPPRLISRCGYIGLPSTRRVCAYRSCRCPERDLNNKPVLDAGWQNVGEDFALPTLEARMRNYTVGASALRALSFAMRSQHKELDCGATNMDARTRHSRIGSCRGPAHLRKDFPAQSSKPE